MDAEMALELTYHLSGIVVMMFLLLVVNTLRKEKEDVIKSRIFIRYGRFKSSFYIASIGAVVFLIGNLAGLYDHSAFHWMHAVGEIVFNSCLAVFVGLLYYILKSKKKRRG
ncbi:MAG: hypothetical protein KKD17_02690 [Nanoarchaeota archaeon]|nr:hypothetical protein [Nanoarchaeota archaeon]